MDFKINKSKEYNKTTDKNKPDKKQTNNILAKSYLIKKKDKNKDRDTIVKTVADTTSAAASLGIFFKIKQSIQLKIAKYYTLGNKNMINNFLSAFKKPEKIVKLLNKKYTPIIAGAGIAALSGSFIKSAIMKLYNFTTGKYKIDKEDKKTFTKEEKKAINKELKKEKKSENLRNSISGGINGLLAPIVSIGGIIGAPIYAAANSFNRYFIGTKEKDNNDKSLSGFTNKLKNNKLANTLSAGIIVAIAALKGNSNKVFDKNLTKTIDKLKNATLTRINETKSSYSQLEDILFSNKKIASIINDNNLKTSDKIQKLSDENIFALKFKQIRSNADELAKALKTDCPATRTLDEAQKLITNSFGDTYEVKNLVGVGTVAETYLVKDKSGKEFCIKMLKDGITADKISKDKDAFIDIINKMSDKTPEEKNFLIKNLENIAQGVVQEVDFSNEKNAAEALAKVTKQAKVVVPVAVKDNLYVMKKADGVSLQSLLRYIDGSEHGEERLLKDIEWLKYSIQNSKEVGMSASHIKWRQDELQKAEANLEALRKFSKEIGTNISQDEAKKLMEKYQDVIIEQFSQVDKNGKIIHGDIHPGNIFIDLNAMRKGDKNFFTLIDTGNTIKQTQDSALRFLNLSSYIKNADVENITKFVLEGASLPQNMTKEQAYEKISKELSKAFFDDKTHIGPVTNDSLLGITDGIMKRLNIIPSDTQGNLLKSKTSADQSMQEFQKTFVESVMKNFEKKFENIKDTKDIKANMSKIVKEGAAATADIGVSMAKYPVKKSLQEQKNLLKLNPADKVKIKKSKSAPKKNSEDYLTYLLKQNKNIKETPLTGDFGDML